MSRGRARRVKIPFVPQMEAVECGAASLTMILRAFGHHAELSDVREACGVSRDGVSARHIVRVARTYHLTPRARKLEPKDLAGVEHPAILHWEMNHFVVLERWTPEEVRILDPAIGPRRIPADDFGRAFTGVCIELSPGEGFTKVKRRRPSLRRYVAMLREARRPLIAIVGLSVVMSALGFAVPMSTKVVVDLVIGAGRLAWLPAVGGGALGLVALLFAASLVRSSLVSRVRDHVDSTMGTALVGHMLGLPVKFFEQRHAADLVARVDAVRVLRELLAERAVSLLVDLPLLLAYLAVLFLFSAQLGLVVTIGVLAYAGVFAAARPRQLAELRERVVKDVRAAIQLLMTMRGIVTLKSAGRELGAHDRWLRTFVAALNAATKEGRTRALAEAGLLAISVATPMAVLFWGGRLALAGALTPGELLAALLVTGALLTPLESAIQALLRLQELPLHLARMDDVFQTAPERTGGRACPPLQGDIHLEDVVFRYGPTSPPTLSGVSLTIRAGEKVALVGPSGSGKSTVAKLILGLHPPESGTIRFDGVDAAELDLDSVRRQIGAVLQETSLFDGTLRENIALYHPSATRDDVVAASRVAQLHDDIEALPLGYDTLVSAQGGPLSGGQRQRLALARAVLHRPPILVLDEATSALDAVTEAAVDGYLSSRACTRVVVAHRLSTVRDADRIVVVVDGKIAEQGRHDELLALGGVYASLVTEGETRRPRAVATAAPSDVSGDDLARFTPFAGLSTEERGELARSFVRRTIPAEEAMLQRGDRAPGLYLVENGALDVIQTEPGLPPLRVATLGAGAVLGEVSTLDGSPASASIVASGRTEVLHLAPKFVERWRTEGDVLAVRLTLALGKLVAHRLRQKTDERMAVGGGAQGEADAAPPDAPMAKTTRASGVLRVEQTALGASLSPREVERLHELGAVRTFRSGEALFRRGDPGDSTHLVLGGRVGVILEGVAGHVNAVRPGEVLGEVALFDPGPRTATCVADGETSTFAIPNAALERLLASGDPMSAKILRHLAHGLTRSFRIADLRLRDAIASASGEQERALVAREEARALAASRDLTLVVEEGGDGRVPIVSSAPELSPAASLAAVLRHAGRPVAVAVVAEACSDQGAISPASLIAGARSFGLVVRSLSLAPADFRHLDEPLLVERSSGVWAVACAWRGGRLEVASPVEGRLDLAFETLATELTGRALEIRFDDVAIEGLGARVSRALSARRGAIVGVVLGAVGGQIAALALPTATSLVVGQALHAGDRGVLQAAAMGLAAAVATQVVLATHKARAVLHLRTHVDAALSDQLFRHVLSLPVDFFERVSPGALLSRFEAFRVVRELLGTRGISALVDGPVLVVSLVAMLAIDPTLSSLAAAVTVLVVGSLLAVLPLLRRASASELAATSLQRTRLLETIAGIVTLRVVGARELGVRRWVPAARQGWAQVSAQERLQGAWTAFADFARLATVGGATWWGASRVVEGTMSLGSMLAFSGVAGAYALSLRDVGGHLVAFSRASRRVQLIQETFAEEPEQLGASRVQPGRLRGRIRLERVSFGYVGGRDVLHDVSLEVEPGTKVALVGGSGSGKSTLGKLLLGLYMPRSGRVVFDGRDVRTLDLGALRSQLGVVLQEGQLFAGSVRENLALNAPDAPIEQIIEAAKRADIHDVIVELPMGYETILSDGGTTFSGGQRQRLALARALVHQPAVLLLDEATSALDNLSQARVERALAEQSCTRVVVAHRLSTVVDADQVIVLEAGRIVEVGTHAELLAKKGHYARLAEAQLA